MDEDERDEAMREVRRTFGERAVRRARARGALSEVKTLMVFLGITLALLAAAILLVRCRG